MQCDNGDSQMNLGFILLSPMTKLIKWGHRAQTMHAKQCRDGGMAERFIDTVTFLGEKAEQCPTLRFLLSASKHNNTVYMEREQNKGIQVFRE